MSIAVLDACVLYPPSLRDLFMWVAATRIYAPRWTEEIQAEWIRNVLADNSDVTPAQLDRTRRLMEQAVPNSVVSGYEAHIFSLNLPDNNDRHVLAAAIEAKAQSIVTYNLSDFLNAILRAYNVQAVSPDDFLSGLFDEQTEMFLRGVRNHRASLHNPPKNAIGYIQTLKVNRLTELALRLTKYENEL